MISFKVRNWNFNSKQIEMYDVMPYFYGEWEERPYYWSDDLTKKIHPKTLDEFKTWFKHAGKYQFWARCQYEVFLTGCPVSSKLTADSKDLIKTDIWDVLEANLDVICNAMWQDLQQH